MSLMKLKLSGAFLLIIGFSAWGIYIWKLVS